MIVNSKNLSFLAVVIQQTSLVLVIRYSKTRVGSIPYLTSVAVFSAELFKLVLNGILEVVTASSSSSSSRSSIESSSTSQKDDSDSTTTIATTGTITTIDELSDVEEDKDCAPPPSTLNDNNSKGIIVSILSGLFDVGNKESLKLVVPAILYVIQNNLLFFALSNLSVPTYQITNQGKLLTTAIISRTMLKKKMSTVQYVAITLLGLGVAVVHISEYQARRGGGGEENKQSSSSGGGGEQEQEQGGNQWLGLLAVFVSCVTSGFCGVYFEMIVKTTKHSVYCRNFHLAFYSLVLAGCHIFYSDRDDIEKGGVFQGFDGMVLLIVVMQGMTGFVVSMMFKYSTAVLKGFATSIAVVVATIASFFLFDTSLNVMFALGATMVASAVKLYSTKNNDATFLTESNETAKKYTNVRPKKYTNSRPVSPWTFLFYVWLVLVGAMVNNGIRSNNFFGQYLDYTAKIEEVTSWMPPTMSSMMMTTTTTTTTTTGLVPACTPEEYYRNRPDGVSAEQFEKVSVGEEIVNFIVAELHKVGAPVAMIFGTALHEYRNGTGNCVHPYAKEDDFDLGVLKEHFHYVVLLIGEIETKFGWEVAYAVEPRFENTFMTIKPLNQRTKKGFQVDIYAMTIDRVNKGYVTFDWDLVQIQTSAMFPLVKHKPIVSTAATTTTSTTTTSNGTMVDSNDTPFLYMPFNPTCYFSNLYGDDFMTPRKVKLRQVLNFNKSKEGYMEKFGNPDCHTELSERDMRELQRQRSFLNQTYDTTQTAADLVWKLSRERIAMRQKLAKVQR